MHPEIRPGRTLANYWDVVVNNWAIAWIRLDKNDGCYWAKLTGKIQGDRDPIEMQSFHSLDEAAEQAAQIFRHRLGND